jgi:cytochrome c553
VVSVGRGALRAAVLIAGVLTVSERSHADMVSMEGVEPWEMCGECHGLDGAGNRIKFPRITGQKPSYIAKQIVDFREGRRTNDGGQMQKTASEIEATDIERVAQWFAEQTAPWPKPTLEAEPDIERARTLSLSGADGLKACLSCHSAAALGIADKPIVAPRIAGQYDYYIAKQLIDYRDGKRSDNDPEQMMTKIARRLSDADITALAVYLSQNPALHDEVVP